MTDRPVIFSGQGHSPRGDKERFVLPAAFRKAVTESSAGKGLMYLSKHERWDCLIGYGQSRRDGLAAQVERDYELAMAAGQPFDRDMKYFQLFDSAEVSFDASGRFIIPRHLRELTEIDGAAYFQGAGPFFTIWAPDVLARQEGPEWASAKKGCSTLLADLGKGRK